MSGMDMLGGRSVDPVVANLHAAHGGKVGSAPPTPAPMQVSAPTQPMIHVTPTRPTDVNPLVAPPPEPVMAPVVGPGLAPTQMPQVEQLGPHPPGPQHLALPEVEPVPQADPRQVASQSLAEARAGVRERMKGLRQLKERGATPAEMAQYQAETRALSQRSIEAKRELNRLNREAADKHDPDGVARAANKKRLQQLAQEVKKANRYEQASGRNEPMSPEQKAKAYRKKREAEMYDEETLALLDKSYEMEPRSTEELLRSAYGTAADRAWDRARRLGDGGGLTPEELDSLTQYHEAMAAEREAVKIDRRAVAAARVTEQDALSGMQLPSEVPATPVHPQPVPMPTGTEPYLPPSFPPGTGPSDYERADRVFDNVRRAREPKPVNQNLPRYKHLRDDPRFMSGGN